MISYRDMAFCTHYESCKLGDVCFRALTTDVKRGAEAWWGGPNAPISVFSERPTCYVSRQSQCESEVRA